LRTFFFGSEACEIIGTFFFLMATDDSSRARVIGIIVDSGRGIVGLCVVFFDIQAEDSSSRTTSADVGLSSVRRASSNHASGETATITGESSIYPTNIT